MVVYFQNVKHPLKKSDTFGFADYLSVMGGKKCSNAANSNQIAWLSIMTGKEQQVFSCPDRKLQGHSY